MSFYFYKLSGHITFLDTVQVVRDDIDGRRKHGDENMEKTLVSTLELERKDQRPHKKDEDKEKVDSHRPRRHFLFVAVGIQTDAEGVVKTGLILANIGTHLLFIIYFFVEKKNIFLCLRKINN